VILSITTASGALADLTHLRGQILVTVGANPGGHVLKEVDLTVDGQVVARQLVSSSSSVSYTLGFDTTKISDGTHRLQAVMVDTDGTLTATNAVTVTIVN
jgi:hypothetical protein